MGVYGHSYTLANSANHQLGAPTVGGGQSGPWTQQMGFLGYNEVYKFNQKLYLRKKFNQH